MSPTLPAWADAICQRLEFFAAPSAAEVAATRAILRDRFTVAADGATLMRRFLDACLAIFAQQVASRPALADHRDELDTLYALARVPGRAVWLAAMAVETPCEEGPAAVMLVNDLASLGMQLPLRAMQNALRD